MSIFGRQASSTLAGCGPHTGQGPPPLPKSPGTTRFEPGLPSFRNLVAGLELAGPNQAWAAGITYVRTDEGFLSLSLVTDMWSRKIVGFHAGDSLQTEGALVLHEV